MSLLEKISQELTAAMKAKDTVKLSTLRMLKAACTNAAIEKKKDALGDPEVLEVIQKLSKQRRESIESFEKAGRRELAENEAKELVILQAYLPKQLSDEEIKRMAQEAVAKSGAKSKGDAGLVMKVLMPLVKGKADGKRVNEIVGSLLA